MAVYGLSAAGKTSLLATVPDPSRAICGSLESGHTVLSDADIALADLTKDDNGNVVPEEQRLFRVQEFYKYLLTPEAQEKYDWVMLDSATEISECIVKYYKSQNLKNTQDMWGRISEDTIGLIKSFRDLPNYNVIITCLAVDKQDDLNRIYKAFDIKGSTSSKFPQFFDEVFYLGVEINSEGSKIRRLLTSSTDKIIAKDRSKKLNQFEEPNLTTIYNKIINKQP